MKTEKTQNNLLTWFILCLVFAAIGAFLAIYFTQPKEIKHTYTVSDSIAKDNLKKRIDTIYVVKNKIKERVKWLKETDTIYYAGNDNTCIEIIERKDKLISGLDSLCDVLDLEARTYSDLNLIEINRNKQLSFQMDSLIVSHYKDSIQQAKTFNKAIQKEKNKTLFYKVTTTVAAALGIYGVVSK